nr:unnamed protein product [Callosobruchus analis]
MRVTVRKLISSQHEDYYISLPEDASVLDLREWIYIESGVEIDCQELFYGGKQVMHGFSLICLLYIAFIGR